MNLDRFTVRKQWKIAWDENRESWNSFEWYCAIFDKIRIRISNMMLFTIIFAVGTSYNYMRISRRNIIVLEELSEANQVYKSDKFNDIGIMNEYLFLDI